MPFNRNAELVFAKAISHHWIARLVHPLVDCMKGKGASSRYMFFANGEISSVDLCVQNRPEKITFSHMPSSWISNEHYRYNPISQKHCRLIRFEYAMKFIIHTFAFTATKILLEKLDMKLMCKKPFVCILHSISSRTLRYSNVCVCQFILFNNISVFTLN